MSGAVREAEGVKIYFDAISTGEQSPSLTCCSSNAMRAPFLVFTVRCLLCRCPRGSRCAGDGWDPANIVHVSSALPATRRSRFRCSGGQCRWSQSPDASPADVAASWWHAVRELIDAVVEDAPRRRAAIETLDTLVNHVAAHEIGHAIYRCRVCAH